MMLAIRLLCILLLLLGGGGTKVENIAESFNEAAYINIYREGEQFRFNSNSDGYEAVLDALERVTAKSYEMPAFGVSLDNETREAMKEGLWVELVFSKARTHNQMPFESLLIKVDGQASGFNLIRGYNGQYAGRCFYLSLDGSMQKIEDTIKTLDI